MQDKPVPGAAEALRRLDANPQKGNLFGDSRSSAAGAECMLLPSTTLLGALNVCIAMCRVSRLREHYFIRFLTARGSYEEQLRQQQKNKLIHLIQFQHINQGCLPESWTVHDLVPVLPLRMLQDPFNVTQTWLDLKGFEYDELIVVDGPESKAVFIDVHCMNCTYCTCVILSIGTNGYTPIDSRPVIPAMTCWNTLATVVERLR